MIPKIDLDTIRFGAPEYLWLLVAPAALFAIWCWQLSRRRRDARQYRQHRRLADPQRGRRSRRPAGRLRLDADARRPRRSLAAIDPVPARARRIAGVEG